MHRTVHTYVGLHYSGFPGLSFQEVDIGPLSQKITLDQYKSHFVSNKCDSTELARLVMIKSSNFVTHVRKCKTFRQKVETERNLNTISTFTSHCWLELVRNC